MLNLAERSKFQCTLIYEVRGLPSNPKREHLSVQCTLNSSFQWNPLRLFSKMPPLTRAHTHIRRLNSAAVKYGGHLTHVVSNGTVCKAITLAAVKCVDCNCICPTRCHTHLPLTPSPPSTSLPSSLLHPLQWKPPRVQWLQRHP